MGAVAHIDDYKKGVMFQPQSRGGMSWNGYESNVLLRNQGQDTNGLPQYVDVARATGADDILDARGLALLDYDNDGDLDLLVSHNPGDLYAEKGVSPSLLRNDIGQKRNWLAVSLQGKTVNRDAIGAEVTIEYAGKKALRLVAGGSGYASQSSERLYFGMGSATLVERLTVRWPGGKQEIIKDVQSCRLIHITEGEGFREQSLPGLNTTLAEAGPKPKGTSSHL